MGNGLCFVYGIVRYVYEWACMYVYVYVCGKGEGMYGRNRV